VLPGERSGAAAASLSIVAGSAFLWLLATLTVATGVVLLVMLRRRAREDREVDQAVARARVALPDPRPHELADEELLDDTELELEDDEPLGKICPACHCRYGHHVSTCSRDDSELAALN
jgi:hypothetical protein